MTLTYVTLTPDFLSWDEMHCVSSYDFLSRGNPFPTPCASLPNSFDRECVHVLERGLNSILSIFNLVPVTGWKTWMMVGRIVHFVLDRCYYCGSR